MGLLSDHLPERDIKVIQALSVSVSFPGPDKRDAADVLHLLRIYSHISCTYTFIQKSLLSVFLSVMFKTDDYMVW